MAAANLLLIAVALVCGWVWIRSLISWDGTYPCKREDCETCPYSGGCTHEEELKKRGGTS